MTLKVGPFIRETSTTTGTGTLNLAGALSSAFETFVTGIGDGNETYYSIKNRSAAEWEFGIGTVTDASPDTLSRDTVIASSNSDSLVSFSAGTKDVICAAPPLYEEDTFTPALAFGGGTTGITYSTQSGKYTRIGRMVFFEINITLSSKGSSTGNATITGLPFSTGSGATPQFTVLQQGIVINTAGGYYSVVADALASSTSIRIFEQGDDVSVAAITDADFSNGTTINVTGAYAV